MVQTGSPCAFQEAVNLTFHEFESAVYDQIHREMWETLPAHFDYLSRALISVLPHDRHLRVLDVGCGTGLSSELLLQTDLSRLICHIDLLDTSEPMLAKVRDRAQKWGVPHATILGTIDAIPPSSQYDLIMACSVLHHIPDLKNAIDKIRKRQGPGDSFMHLQDPNADMLSDPALHERKRRLRSIRRAWTPSRLVKAIRNRLRPAVRESYLELVNTSLIARTVIRKEMSAQDMWAVTDIHVGSGRGISLTAIGQVLDEYSLVATRPYSFFGEMSSTLPVDLQAEERQLLVQGAANGSQIAAAWLHTGGRP